MLEAIEKTGHASLSAKTTRLMFFTCGVFSKPTARDQQKHDNSILIPTADNSTFPRV
jgi:hypothetical protein